MKTTPIAATLAALPLALALGACSDNNSANPTVGQKVDSAVATTKTDLSNAGTQLKDATNNAAADIKEKVAEAQPAMDDAAITASVKTDILKDPDLSVLKIDVDTKDGVVTLNGLASNEAAKGRAQLLASGVKGVKEVRNFLTVKHA